MAAAAALMIGMGGMQWHGTIQLRPVWQAALRHLEAVQWIIGALTVVFLLLGTVRSPTRLSQRLGGGGRAVRWRIGPPKPPWWRWFLVGGLVLLFVVLSWGDNKTRLRETGLTYPAPMCARPSNDTLVLFVHGWRGDDTTWQDFPRMVCTDPRFAKADVTVVNYPTFMADVNLNITQIADWIFRNGQTGDYAKYRHLAIVAHSMGGLVSRQLVILYVLARRGDEVSGLVEVATPHEGGRAADIAAALGLSRPYTEEMTAGSSFLTTERTLWGNIQPPPRSECFTSPQDLLVPEGSAGAQCTHVFAYPQGGHTDLVKPSSPSDQRYVLPTAELVKFLAPELGQ